MIETIVTTTPQQLEVKDITLYAELDHQSVEMIETLATTVSKELEARSIALDAEVLIALHPTARIVRASDHGTNHTSRTIHFCTRSPMPNPLRGFPDYWTGIHRQYFLKVLPSKTGHDILRGEYNSLKAINDVSPYSYFVPRPLKWGSLAQDPDLHFLLTQYHDLDSQVLNTDRFVTTLASLHLKSASDSDTFGFHVSTYNGALPQINRRTATWEEYFSTNFRNLLDLEKDIQGPHTPEMHTLTNALLSAVIPRLLRPLETSPNSIKPTLLHGNLTSANVSTSLHTKAPIIYSPCAFYGHNEYDLCAFVEGRFGVQALEMYHRLVPVSEPREDFGDRMRLYGLRALLAESRLRLGEGRWRERTVEEMRVLVERYRGSWQDVQEG